MNKLDKDYQALLQDILDNSVEKEDRTGTGTKSVFGRQIRHKMSDGFPALTTKKLAFKTMTTELLWFLKGDTNIKYLVDNGCNIWNGDAYKKYISKQSKPKIGDWENYIDCYCGHTDTCDCGPLSQEEFINKIKTDDEFAAKWGELGPIYGKQWRSWKGDTWVEGNTDGTEGFYLQSETIDQIQNLINDLKTNPDSRRLMVSAWNVGELDQMTLPPCHYGFQVYTRPTTREEKITNPGKYRAISLMFNMRSNDVPLGLPFNIASYALLLEIIGKMVNMVPDELIANLGDAHIYKNQIDGVKEQLTRTPMNLPGLMMSDDIKFNGTIDEFLESCTRGSFKLDGYESHPSIKIPLSN